MRSDPFLWIHLSGLAAFPLFLQLAWLGLSVGDPLPFIWLEWLFLIAIAIVPIFWMQWNRPFDIFSLLVVALRPNSLTPEQLKILRLFKAPKQRLLTIVGTILMIGIGGLLYQFAPLASTAASFLPQWRLLGLLIAGVALLAGHLFLQVPLSVLGVLLTNEQQWTATEPLPQETVAQGFTLLGFRVNKILPNLD